MRSSLSRIAHLSQEPDPKRAWQIQAEAFHRDGVVCLSLEQAEAKLGWAAARQLRNIGEQAFGKKGEPKK